MSKKISAIAYNSLYVNMGFMEALIFFANIR